MRARLLLGVSIILYACDGRPAAPTSSVRSDEVSFAIQTPNGQPRDLFFVVDAVTTPSERAREAGIVATIVGGLVTGDVDGDGSREITPENDVRVMIVPNDPTLLRPEEIPEFEFDFARGDDPDTFVRTVHAAAMNPLGGGSGWPQPLEAALFAITEGCVPRTEATVGVVFLSTTDDCSLADAELADPNSTRYAGAPAERCVRYADTALQPLSRYAPVLGRGDRHEFAVAVIVGPSDGEIVTAPRVSDSLSLAARPGIACTTPAGVEAVRANRLNTFARQRWLGTLDSICARDHVEALRPFWIALGPSTQPRGCIATPEPLDLASCDLLEMMPENSVGACADLPGRVAMELAGGRSTCLVSRASSADDTTPGWADSGEDRPTWECDLYPSSIAFTRTFRHRTGAQYVMQCTR